MRSLIALSALALAACAAETSSPAIPDHFEVVQAPTSGTPGRALDSLLLVRLLDDRGDPMSGVEVHWSVTSGGGHLETVSTTTGSDGLAAARWVLGPFAGEQLLRVSTPGAPSLDLPVEVDGLRAIAVAVTEAAACALDSLGSVWCWGGHPYWQPSQHAYGDTPVLVDSGHTFRQIVGGTDHFCALTAAGAAWCWGVGLRGELGTGASVAMTSVPVPATGGHTFTTLTATTWATCGLDPAGQAWCWGSPGDGSLGTGSASQFSPAPVLQGTTTFGSISLGYEHVCALELDGQAWCWGHQDVGQLGDSIGGSTTIPRRVQGPIRFRAITAGDHFTCAIAVEGGLWCWGAPPLAPYRQSQGPVSMGVSGLNSLMGDDSFIVGLKASRPLSAGLSWYTGVPEALGGGALKEMPGNIYAISQIALRWSTICMLRSDQLVLCAGNVPGYGPTAEPAAIPHP